MQNHIILQTTPYHTFVAYPSGEGHLRISHFYKKIVARTFFNEQSFLDIWFMDLKTALHFFANISVQDFALAENYFVTKQYKKGEVMNVQNKLGGDLAFIIKGLIRVYYIEPKTGKEINLFFFQDNQFIFSFLIFSGEDESNYFVETMEECELIQINRKNLSHLYKTSHQWEHFGRLLAEEYYRGSNARSESFIFMSPEERYLELIKTFPTIFQRTSLMNIASYLGIESQSLSRIRKRLAQKKSK